MSHCVSRCAVIQLYYSYLLVSVSSWGEFPTVQQKEVPPAFPISLRHWYHWRKVVPMDSLTSHCWLLLGTQPCGTAPAGALVKLIKVTAAQEEWKAQCPTPNHCMATQTQVKEALWAFQLEWRGQVSSTGKTGVIISASFNYLWNHSWNFSTNNVRRTVEIELNSVKLLETLPQ